MFSDWSQASLVVSEKISEHHNHISEEIFLWGKMSIFCLPFDWVFHVDLKNKFFELGFLPRLNLVMCIHGLHLILGQLWIRRLSRSSTLPLDLNLSSSSLHIWGSFGKILNPKCSWCLFHGHVSVCMSLFDEQVGTLHRGPWHFCTEMCVWMLTYIVKHFKTTKPP